jgi:hypothetical protein
MSEPADKAPIKGRPTGAMTDPAARIGWARRAAAG